MAGVTDLGVAGGIDPGAGGSIDPCAAGDIDSGVAGSDVVGHVLILGNTEKLGFGIGVYAGAGLGI